MKITTWNVGTTYERNRQSYKWKTFMSAIRYSGIDSASIYCLQEVPTSPPGNDDSLTNAINMAKIYRKYYLLRSPGDKYSLLSLVDKSFVQGGCTPQCVNLSLDHYSPFAQRISFLSPENHKIVIFNVHLLAFKKDKSRPNAECAKLTKLRARQIAALKTFCKAGDILCGDFNISQQDHGSNRPNIADAFPELRFVWPPTPPSPLSYVQNILNNNSWDIREMHQYDYIARYDGDPINFSIRDPGHSGGNGTFRHLPVTAEITLP